MKEKQEYKTESQLKAEAKGKAKEQAKRDAEKKASPAQKQAENYWYHYKWHTIAGVVILVVVLFFARDLFRARPDFSVVVATTTPVSDAGKRALQLALEELAMDYNGDGIVRVELNFLSVPRVEASSDNYADAIKLTTVVAAGEDPLYLLDDASYQYLMEWAGPNGEPPGDGGIFQALGLPGAEGDRLEVSDTLLGDLPELRELWEYSFAFRDLEVKDHQYLGACYELLAALTKE